ncbi:hypothetical protein P615_23845 [Brevibacillus laterosporus PE36]|nr:hypothetical protein P615_23845 [Brevibacillus laterosporus PE36]
MMLCKKIGMKLIIYPVKSKEQKALPSNEQARSLLRSRLTTTATHFDRNK